MPIQVSISDLLGTAALASRTTSNYAEDVRAGDADELQGLRNAVEYAVQALAEIVVAQRFLKHGVARNLTDRNLNADEPCELLRQELMAALDDWL